MCGIDGLFSPLKDVEVSRFYDAHLLLKHRGPDDEGFIGEVDGEIKFFKGNDTTEYFSTLPHINSLKRTKLVFGHRRLAIIDLSPGGHQPFPDDEKNYFLVYNGEIFNYLELREELEKLGHHFYSNSDSEVVLKAFIQWGKAAFNKFNGMWALAIYDRKNNSVILSRDRFGMKPLFYTITNNVIYFASEMKFLEKIVGKNFSLNKGAVYAYIRRCYLNYSSQSFWNEIKELEPGHFLIFQDNSVKLEKYWNFSPQMKSFTDTEVLETFTYLFEDSLKIRMRSDVEVGTLLSGGLDSNLIVNGLNKLGFIKNGNFKSFSAVFEEEIFSEKKYIEETLRRVELKSYFIWPKPEKLNYYLEKLFTYNEQPFRSLSLYSQFLIYEKIKNTTGVKVLLNGQGGDELFGGYSYHYYYLFVTLLRKLKINKFISEINLLIANRSISKGKIFYNLLKNLLSGLIHKDYFNYMTFNEVISTPLREYLSYDDRTSMAFGLEARAPFLDHRLVEFAFSLDERYKIDNFVNKKIVRKYASDFVPEGIIIRKDKTGFVSPQELWQRKELYSQFQEIFPYLKQVLPGCLPSIFAKISLLRYQHYLEGKNNDWPFVWRIFCLYQWMKFKEIL